LDLVSEARRIYPTVPLILMTAQGSEEIAVKALQAGAAGYVAKRKLSAQLVGMVRTVLEAAAEEQTQMVLMQQLQSRQEVFRLKNDTALVLALPRYVRQVVGDSWGLDSTERIRLGTALEEALLNAYYHGNLEVSSVLKEGDFGEFYRLAEERCAQAPYCDRRILVEFALSREETTIRIHDEGPGFNPAALPDPTDVINLERPSGRGVLLMRAFMDSVSYNDRGNQVTLVKRRKSRADATACA
jgi:anti-sigma regulatory factor (Ser/Thr protein kinase)